MLAPALRKVIDTEEIVFTCYVHSHPNLRPPVEKRVHLQQPF